MKLAVIGCGNVGFSFLRWLKENGHSVLGYDTDETVKQKICDMMGPDSCALSYKDLLPCEAVFICVPTEPSIDGSADMSIFDSVIDSLIDTFSNSNNKVAIIQRSTCPPGSAVKYASMFSENVSYAVNPSFLRKSSIDFDTRNPDRVAIGGSGYARMVLDRIYVDVCAPRIISENYTTIELLKYIENTLDAMLITYWNSILEYATIVGVEFNDIKLLIEHIADKDKFKNVARVPGKAYGLWCLPKDVQALIHSMNLYGVDSSLFEAIHTMNLRFDRMVGTGLTPAQELVSFKSGTARLLDSGEEQINNSMNYYKQNATQLLNNSV